MKKKIIIAVIFCIILTLLYIGVKDKENVSINDLSKNIELITVHESYAANQKVTELAELATTPEGTDMVYIIDDPGGTPISKNITITNLLGAETNSLETVTTGIATTEIPIGTGVDTVVYAPLSGDVTMTNGGVMSVSDLTIASESGGDILYFDSSNWIRLAKGTAAQLLQMNSGATAPEWTSTLGLAMYSSTSHTANAVGEFDLDTDGDGATITQGIYGVHDGTQLGLYFPLDAYPTADNQIQKYDAATNKLKWEADSTGSETNSLETVTTGIATTEIPIGTGVDTVVYAPLSGDVTMDNAGAVTIAANAVENLMMADNAIDTAELAVDAVEGTKIADDQIDSEHYVAASIDNEHLAVNSIDSDQYVDGSIDMEHISDMYAYQEMPIAWMKDGSSPPDAIDDGTTRSPYAYRTFDNTADEDLNFVWIVPADLSGSAVQFRVYYLVTNATGPSGEGVAFGLSGVSLGDNDLTNAAKGTVVVITDPTITAVQHDILITGWSGDVTITNLLAGEVAEIALIRDVSDAADDYAQVVGAFMVQIRYVKNPAR